MINQLFGAAIVAALAYSLAPAHAARVRPMACRGDNLASAESMVETLPDGPVKFMARREIAKAQEAMLKNNLRGCAMHLDKAALAGTMAQAPSERPLETTGQAPDRVSPQPQWDWQPLQVAQ